MTAIIDKDTMADTERRRYFRIEDELMLACRKIDPAEIPRDGQAIPGRPDVCILSAQLESLHQESKILLRRIEKNDPVLAEYLLLMDKRIGMLSDFLLQQETAWEEYSILKVNLSASGMVFPSPFFRESGEVLELRLILLPKRTGLRLYGRVINCEYPSQLQPESHRVTVDFMGISDADREILITHLISKQREQLRNGNEAVNL